ncbi:MAG: cysteine desulfurase-like protein [Zavarzinella sp.]
MFPVDAIRARFPALQREMNGRKAVFFDGPAGSQVPSVVIESIKHYYEHHNANHGGSFLTSRESDAVVDGARTKVASFLNARSDQEIVFGANMTTLTFAFSRALAATWQPGDEILVSQADHDANVSPWVRAAADRGVTVKHIPLISPSCRLDLEAFQQLLSPKTKLVAVSCASNAVGTIQPFQQMIPLAHAVGAEVFLDAVHFAPHQLVDVQAWDCDYLCCSAYKFFGPHVGILYAKQHRLEELQPYKVRPSPETNPDRWMTGTQNFAAIAGVGAAIDYLASIAPSTGPVRTQLETSFQQINAYEQQLCEYFLTKLASIPGSKVWGVTKQDNLSDRVATFGITFDRHTPRQVADALAEYGIFSWAGNFYALPLTEALNLEPEGMLRIGLLHYNTTEEIDYLVSCLQQILE